MDGGTIVLWRKRDTMWQKSQTENEWPQRWTHVQEEREKGSDAGESMEIATSAASCPELQKVSVGVQALPISQAVPVSPLWPPIHTVQSLQDFQGGEALGDQRPQLNGPTAVASHYLGGRQSSLGLVGVEGSPDPEWCRAKEEQDRKSTRLNSSHL